MDIGIDSYRLNGIPPPALLNFSALLGWNPGALPNKGVMDLEDMVKNVSVVRLISLSCLGMNARLTNLLVPQFDLKFTKGDIIVNPEKLAFFHKKHVQKALNNPSPKNNSLIDEYIAGPVLRKAREIEAERKRLLVDEASQSVDLDLLTSLGEPMLDLTSPAGEQDGSDAIECIRNALRISRSEAMTPTAVIDANRYLIWQPPTRRLKESFAGLLSGSTKILVDGKSGSVTDALEYLSSRLGQVDDTHWSVSHLQLALDEATKRVICSEEERPPTPAGYKFLRWALLGLDNGPQMSHMMEYLGRTETLRRLQVASTVARSEPAGFPDTLNL